MEDITTKKLSNIDYAMLVQYGVDVISTEELEAQAQAECENELRGE